MRVPSLLVRSTSRVGAWGNYILLAMITVVCVVAVVAGVGGGSVWPFALFAALWAGAAGIAYVARVRPRLAIARRAQDARDRGAVAIAAEGVAFGRLEDGGPIDESGGPLLVTVDADGIRFDITGISGREFIPASAVETLTATRVVPLAGFSKVLRISTLTGDTVYVYLACHGPLSLIPPRDADVERVASEIIAALAAPGGAQ